MAVYLVEGPKGKRLIEAKTKSGAIRFASGTDYTAQALKPSDLWKAMKADNLEVETATEEDTVPMFTKKNSEAA